MDDWRSVPGNDVAWRRLLDLLRSGEGLAFVGHVASSPTYLPWHLLLQRLLRTPTEDDSEHRSQLHYAVVSSWTNPPAAGDAVAEALGWDGYLGALRRHYRPTSPSGTPPHSPIQGLLARLPFHGILTTAFDLGLIGACARHGLKPSQVATWLDLDLDAWLSQQHDAPMILHVCGLPEQPQSIRHFGGLFHEEMAEPALHVTRRQALERLWRERDIVLLADGLDDHMAVHIARSLQASMSGADVHVWRHLAVLPCSPDRLIDAAAREAIGTLYGADVLFYPRDEASPSYAQVLSILEAALGALESGDDAIAAVPTTDAPPATAQGPVDLSPPSDLAIFRDVGAKWDVAFGVSALGTPPSETLP